MNQGFLGDSTARIEKLKYKPFSLNFLLKKKTLKNRFIFREEIRDLESKVQRERERYKLSTQTLSGGFSAIPMMPINSAVKQINEMFMNS